jgi:hypothetical protein
MLYIIILILFYVLLQTLPPTVYIGDSGELITSSLTLGIGHPPGYPLYLLIGKISSLLPVGDIAFRYNLLSTIFAIFVFIVLFNTCFLFCKILLKNTNDFFLKISCFSVSIIFCLSYIFWSQSGNAKGGIYVLSHLILLLTVYYFFKYLYQKKDKFLILSIYLSGFLPSIHFTTSGATVFLILAAIFFIKNFSYKKNFISIFLFFLSLLTPYLYLFLRVKNFPIVHWHEINATPEIIGFILRKPYSIKTTVPFNFDIGIFKIKNYIGQLIRCYHFFIVFIIWGFFLLFRYNKILFYFFISFFVFNLGGVIFLTGNSFSPFTVYVNTNFYIFIDIILIITASLALYKFLFYIKKEKTAKYSLYLLPVFCFIFQLSINYNTHDHSKKFLAYDHILNIERTLNPGDKLFSEEDFDVFNIMYFKYVKNKFKNIDTYDRNGSFLDTSIFREARKADVQIKFKTGAFSETRLRYMKQKVNEYLQNQAEYSVYKKNPEKTYYSTFTEFSNKEQEMYSVPYGIIYKIQAKKELPKNSHFLMQLYTLRYLDKNFDLYYRDLLARYYVQAARYSAYLKDEFWTKYHISKALEIASISPAILNLVASIYYYELDDKLTAIKYMEDIIKLDPYDFTTLNILVKMCLEVDKKRALNWMWYFYNKSMDNDIKNTVIEYINRLNYELNP